MNLRKQLSFEDCKKQAKTPKIRTSQHLLLVTAIEVPDTNRAVIRARDKLAVCRTKAESREIQKRKKEISFQENIQTLQAEASAYFFFTKK